MRRLIFTAFTALFIALPNTSKALTHPIQSKDNVESYGDLTRSQREKLRSINIKYGKKFKAIGQDRSLSGREKGLQKRALAEEKRAEIRKVKYGDSSNKDYDNREYYSSKYTEKEERAIRKIEANIDRLEGRYKLDKADLKDSELSYEEYKQKKEVLKKEYKRKKELLKQEKDKVKRQFD